MIKALTAKISGDALMVLSFNSINYLSSFMLAVFISRFLGIENFGEYSFIYALILLLGMTSDFGLSTLLVRKINENKYFSKDLIFNINLIKIFISIILIAFVFSAVFFFFNKFFYPAFIISMFIILPRTLISTYESSLRSFLNQKYPAIIKSINSVSQVAVSFLLLVKGAGLTEIFLCILILDSITALILHIANDKVIREFSKFSNYNLPETNSPDFITKSVSVIRESSVFFFVNFLMLSMKGLNVILLGFFSTAESVGIYSAGSKFVNAVGLFSGALFNSFYPVISNLKNDIKMKIEVTKKFIIYAFTAGAALTVSVFFLSEYLIEFTFKTEQSVIVLKILSLTMLPVLVYTITQSFLFSVYSEKFLMKILFLTWCLNLILSVVLIFFFDYTGCAAAFAATEIFLMLNLLYKFISDEKIFENQKVTK